MVCWLGQSHEMPCKRPCVFDVAAAPLEPPRPNASPGADLHIFAPLLTDDILAYIIYQIYIICHIYIIYMILYIYHIYIIYHCMHTSITHHCTCYLQSRHICHHKNLVEDISGFQGKAPDFFSHRHCRAHLFPITLK